MNIFFLDNDVEKNAMLYHDAHVRKIIVEIAQMLSTAMHYECLINYYKYKSNDLKTIKIENDKYKINNKEYVDVPEQLQKIYKPAYINHPMTKWVRETGLNFYVTKNILDNLLIEYYYRFNKIHKCSELSHNLKLLYNSSLELTTPPQCMPEKYKCDDFIQAYRRYYIGEKQYDKNGKPHKWTKRDKPEFILNAEKDAKSILENAKEHLQNRIIKQEMKKWNKLI
ncbi:MAG: hypothetical protein PHI22_03960 [Bacilli bacterium]|nr:hypothetical protein [Bacilli bacterium]